MTELSRRRRSLVLAICCASMIVVVMDISIVNVALPTIRRDLHASVSGLQWTVDAYTLVLASFLLLAGSTADRVGRRRIFQIGLLAFGVGSLLCGLAPSIGWLIAARAVQAVGGTMLNPVAMAIIADTFTDAGRAGQGDRCVRLDVRPLARAGTDPRRRPGRRARLALHLLDQRADRGRRDRAAPRCSCPSPGRPGRAGSTRSGSSW